MHTVYIGTHALLFQESTLYIKHTIKLFPTKCCYIVFDKCASAQKVENVFAHISSGFNGKKLYIYAISHIHKIFPFLSLPLSLTYITFHLCALASYTLFLSASLCFQYISFYRYITCIITQSKW